MAIYAVLFENIVKNIIVADSKEIAELVTGLTCIESNEAGIGDTFDSEQGIFIKPITEDPQQPLDNLENSV